MILSNDISCRVTHCLNKLLQIIRIEGPVEETTRSFKYCIIKNFQSENLGGIPNMNFRSLLGASSCPTSTSMFSKQIFISSFPGFIRNAKKTGALLRLSQSPTSHHAHRNSTYVNNHWFHSQAKNNKLRIKKALIVTKLTRYEFEKIRHSELNNLELEEKIRCRGTDFDALMHYHNLHKETEHRVVDCFRNFGVEVKVVNRLTINRDLLNWTDVLVPVGGDGTFLLAASRASPLFIDNSVPIVGFNSDPQRSEGRLMLPKQYSSDVNDAVKKLLTGEFEWMHRSRLRITLLGVNGNAPVPIDLHEYNTAPVEHKEVIISEPTLLDQINGNGNGCTNSNGKKKKFTKRMLPYLSLNEVRIVRYLFFFHVTRDHLQIVFARLSALAFITPSNEKKASKTRFFHSC